MNWKLKLHFRNGETDTVKLWTRQAARDARSRLMENGRTDTENDYAVIGGTITKA